MRQHPNQESYIAEHNKDLIEDAIKDIEKISEQEGTLWVINGLLFHYAQIPDFDTPRVLREYERDEVKLCEEISTALAYTI